MTATNVTISTAALVSLLELRLGVRPEGISLADASAELRAMASELNKQDAQNIHDRAMAAKRPGPAAPATAVREAHWSAPRKDQYGRSCTYLTVAHVLDGRWVKAENDVAVVITLPKSYTAARPFSRYMCNTDRTAGPVDQATSVSEWLTRKEAKAHAEDIYGL